MRSLRALAALASWAAAIATASAEPPRCSIRGAESWREYRTAHFIIATDVRRSTASALISQLEHTRALVVQALFGEQVEIPGRVRVVAFGEPRQFEALAPKDAGGYIVRTRDEPIIVVPFEGRAPLFETVAHELVHHVSWFLFPRQPMWFQEGIAQFVGTVGSEASDDGAPAMGTHIRRGGTRTSGRWTGVAPRAIVREIQACRLVTVKELLEWKGATDAAEPWRHHVTSWLLYHWLWNERSKQLTAFQQRLSNGEDPGLAWRAVFPEYDASRPGSLASLDEALARYRTRGRFLTYRIDVAERDGPVTERPIPSADLHVLLLAARGNPEKNAGDGNARSRAEIDEALREDAAQPEAVYFRSLRDGRDPAPALRNVVAARPQDARAWFLLGGALDSKASAAEKEAAYRKAVALDPESARANNDLAWLLVKSGRAREARPFADRALDLAPWDRASIDTLAVVAMELGQCKAAVQLERRAADLYGENEQAGAEIRTRLAEYEARCGAEVPMAK